MEHTRGPEDARLGRRASHRAAESRGRARLGGTGRVSALKGAEASCERALGRALQRPQKNLTAQTMTSGAPGSHLG